MRTSAVTINSHTHGRERRTERGIEKRELQKAVKEGVKEPANPGRTGDKRWRFTHNGVVYITDDSCKHEITSWRLDDGSINLAAADGVGGAHVVLVVDHSGSMRKPDVEHYSSRTEAVYDCLAKDFVTAQLAAGAGGAEVVVSVIQMSDGATLILNKARLHEDLAKALKARGSSYARSHGNYLPALDKALEILQEDAPNRGTLMLLFLSDGAPSDHSVRKCPHGYQVWQDLGNGAVRSNGKKALTNCPIGHWQCRKSTKDAVENECVQRILQIGDVLGRDRVVVGTVAFGDPNQDYSVLKQMGEALPRGSFQKLGLHAGGLRTAFSSLSSSLTTLRTEGGSRSLTLRNRQVKKDVAIEVDMGVVSNSNNWFIYNGERYVEKFTFGLAQRALVKLDFPAAGMTGLAFVQQPFAQGVERFVYRCAEVTIPQDRMKEWYDDTRPDFPNQAKALRGSLRLVAKEAKHHQNLGRRFQVEMARVQAEAAEMARAFNRRIGGPPKMQLNFLDCHVYNLYDNTYPGKEAWVLVESELEVRKVQWRERLTLTLTAHQHPQLSPSALTLHTHQGPLSQVEQ